MYPREPSCTCLLVSAGRYGRRRREAHNELPCCALTLLLELLEYLADLHCEALARDAIVCGVDCGFGTACRLGVRGVFRDDRVGLSLFTSELTLGRLISACLTGVSCGAISSSSKGEEGGSLKVRGCESFGMGNLKS